MKGTPAGASIRICSVASTSPRCAAATSGTQPTAAISGRASGTRACVEKACGLDRRRSVVGRADALQGENSRCGALLQRRCGTAGTLARLVADVVRARRARASATGPRSRARRRGVRGEVGGVPAWSGRVFGLAGANLSGTPSTGSERKPRARAALSCPRRCATCAASRGDR